MISVQNFVLWIIPICKANAYILLVDIHFQMVIMQQKINKCVREEEKRRHIQINDKWT